MNRQASIAMALALLCNSYLAGQVQTAFTYQGQLKDAGVPVADPGVPMTFQLFDAAAGGNPVGGALAQSVSVQEGLFTVLLDFGPVPDAFNGQPRWLQITVNGNPLSPRQALTPTPYAMHSQSAATVPDGSIGTNQIADGSITADKISPVGLPCYCPAMWLLGGNVGTNPLIHFVGTIDNQPLVIRSFNRQVMRYTYVEDTSVTNFEYRSANILGGTGANVIGPGVIGATIAGGGRDYFSQPDAINSVTASWGAVGGGLGNTVNSPVGTVAGGAGNTASGDSAAVVGGYANTAGSTSSFVGGGVQNNASGPTSAIAGGYANTASGAQGAIGGGYLNIASGQDSTVAGGEANHSTQSYASIGGGHVNLANSLAATVAGGYINSAKNLYGTVGGGRENTVNGEFGTIGGGYLCTTGTGWATTIAGGHLNNAAGGYAAIGGGYGNQAGGDLATIAGGGYNQANLLYATVGGGYNNNAAAQFATIGGGHSNTANIDYATVSGGEQNLANNYDATVGGGRYNTALGASAGVASGEFNAANLDKAFIGGGGSNTANGGSSGILGGVLNVTSGLAATVGCGIYNAATADYATVPGGFQNTAGGQFSLAAGQQANAMHTGTFVWADSQGAAFASTAADQYLIRAQGGVGINTNSPGSFALCVNGSAGGTSGWGTCSDARYKTRVETIPDALYAVLRLRGVTFDWRRSEFPEKRFSERRQVGLIAQEVEQVLPELVTTGGDGFKSVSYAEVAPVLVEAVKQQQQQIEELRAELARVREQLAQVSAAAGGQR